MNKSWGLVLLVSSNVLATAPAAAKTSTTEVPRTMAAIGDSVTAGAVAQFTTESWVHPKELLSIYYRLFRAKIKNSVEPAQRKDLSWSTGLNRYRWVHSHFALLSYLAYGEGKRIAAYNAAVSQEDSRDAFDQLNNVLNWSLTTQNQQAPDYVTIFIGANDLCNDKGQPPTPVETYRGRINKLVHEILIRNKKSKVMLIEIPDLNRVWAFAHEKRLSRIKNFQSCSALWRSVDLCQSVLGDLEPAQRKMMENINRGYNRVLNETVAQFSAQRGRYGSDRVRIAKGFFDHEPNFDDMAIDCFHPNYRGQSKIGTMSFYQSWWAPRFKTEYDGYMPWVRLVQTKKIR